MRPVRYTLSDASGGAKIGAVVPPDMYQNPFSVSLQVVVTGTATYTVEYTEDDVWAATFDPATATWIALDGMTAATASANATLTSPVTGVRARQTAGSGSIAFTLLQGGVMG